jgi:hypothetical protein
VWILVDIELKEIEFWDSFHGEYPTVVVRLTPPTPGIHYVCFE